MPLVSIIVPVYNTENYLKKCLESIKNQTLKDFECILVDDGSTDSSGLICDSFALDDERFSVIHLENGGVSRARNEGIKRANSDYIGFVDSDDWIDPEMFETLYADAKKSNAEISICDTYENHVKTDFIEMDSSQARICLFSNDGFQGYSVNKLVKRELFGHCLYDENLRCYEDFVLYYQLLSKCSKVVWNARPLYHYYRHDGTISTNYVFDKAKQDGINRLRQLMIAETDNDIIVAMKHYFFCYYLETAINYVSHRNVSAEGYNLSYEYIVANKGQVKDCSFRQKIWMAVILHKWLQKLYWVLKRV